MGSTSAVASANSMQTLTLTVPEAARRLGIARQTAYEAVRQGEIPSIRIARRILVPIAALEALLAGTKPAAAAAPEAPRRHYRTRGRRRSGRRGGMAPDPRSAP